MSGTVWRNLRPRAMLAGLAGLVAGCAVAPCQYCGVWRADAERTLAEMQLATKQTAAQRAAYREYFLGRLTVEFERDRFRIWRDDETPEDVRWVPMQAERLSDDTWATTSAAGRSEITLQDDCYVVYVDQLGFKEWFCRTR